MARAAGVTIGTPSTVFTGCSMTLFGQQQLWWAQGHHSLGPRPWRRFVQSRRRGPGDDSDLALRRSRGDMS